MAGKSDYLENAILNFIFNGAPFTPPSTIYIALFTDPPTDAGGGTEVTGGGYARKAVTCNTTNFPTATAGVIENAVAQTFATATADWGTIQAIGIFDALNGGNLLYWVALTNPRTVLAGDVISINVSGLTITED